MVIAEDNVEHQRILAEALGRLGHSVTVTGDGREALAAVAQWRPDLVVADVDMPYLDGLQLCHAMRARPDLCAIPVVLVTAYLAPGDPRLAGAGVTAVVHKPFTVAELTAALSPFLVPPPPPPPAAAVEPPPRDRPELEPAFVEALLRSLDTGVIACDPEGRLLVYNDVLRKMVGDLGESVPLREWPRRFALLHHDGRPLLSHETALSRALAGEHVERSDMLAHDREGRPRWFTVNARPILGAGGKPLGAVAAVHDITAEYRAQQYQTCKAEVLRALATSPDPAAAGAQIVRAVSVALGWAYVRLWLVDPVTGLLRPAATYTTEGERPLPVPAGLARGQGLAGRCWEGGELLWVPDIHAADSPVLPEVLAQTAFRAAGAAPIHGGDGICGVLTFFSYSPQEPEPALAVLLTGIAGTIGGYLEQRRADVLSQHLAAATDEYIALVGHELRTPLTSIASYIDLIAESADSTPLGEVRDLIEVVQRNSARLRGIVDRLLDLASLEAGNVRLNLTDVDLVGLVTDAVDAVADKAAQRRIRIVTDVPESLVIRGDQERLRQVVDNLLDNAIKFSSADSAVAVDLTADGPAAVLTVADRGVGVPSSGAPHVFRRLFRADNARHNGLPGAGLGLALSRVVVELHRGAITLGSNQGAGTTVTVRLPR